MLQNERERELRSEVFVSLTTLPSRISLIEPTLKSLSTQTIVPAKILLCLPRVSLREGVPYKLPGFLQQYSPLVECVTVDKDYGPGTKLLGAIHNTPEDAIIIIADDDMIYHPRFVESLAIAQASDTSSSFTFCICHFGPFVVAQGVDGVSFYKPNLDRVESFASSVLENPYVRVVDDLWISAYLMQRKVTIRRLERPDGVAPWHRTRSHSSGQLQHIQGDLSRSNAMLMAGRYLKERGIAGRIIQIRSIILRTFRSLLGASRGCTSNGAIESGSVNVFSGTSRDSFHE